MTDDRGQAALAERLREIDGWGNQPYLRQAAEMLGDEGAFLPDGTAGLVAALRERGWQDEYEGETAAAMNYGDGRADAGVEVERLRAALSDAISELHAEPNGYHHCRWCSGVDRHTTECAWVARNERIEAIRSQARAALAPEEQ